MRKKSISNFQPNVRLVEVTGTVRLGYEYAFSNQILRNKTESGPIRSVIIGKINKIGQPSSRKSEFSSIVRTELTPFLRRNLINLHRNTLTPMRSSIAVCLYLMNIM